MLVDKSTGVPVHHTKADRIFPLIKHYGEERDLSFESLLDVGAGTRTLNSWFERFPLTRQPASYAAAESDPKIVDILKERSLETIDPFKEDRPSDLVVAMEVLEHITLEDAPGFMDFCARNTKKMFAMTCPNFEGWRNLKPIEEMKECRYIPDHFRYFDPKSSNPHVHKQETTPKSVYDQIAGSFDPSLWDIKVYRAWPWSLTDLSRSTVFQVYFKVFAVAVRK